MKYHFILIFAFITSGIDSRSLRKSNYDQEALRVQWSPRVNLFRQNEISEITESTEAPNESDDLTARETNNEILTNLPNNRRSDQSSPLMLSQNKKLENLLTDFAITYGDEQNAMQWPKRMKFAMDQFSHENDSVYKFSKSLNHLGDIVDSSAPSLQILETVNSFKDLVDSTGELDIHYQDDQDDNGHVKLRDEDSSVLFPQVRNEIFGLNQIDSNISNESENEKNSTAELDIMLSELQGQVERMRKYLHIDCRKYRKSAATTSPINQANKISTLE